jgi:hypothetical protein
MKEFTSTELRVKSSDVYNEVHKAGAVVVNHRDRPDMILITREVLEKSLKSGAVVRN